MAKTVPPQVKLSALKVNPNNPRIIKDESFIKLVENLLKFPKFISHRPIVQADGIIYAGNMRYKAIEHIVKMPEKEYLQLVNDKLKLDVDIMDTWAQVRKEKAVPKSWIGEASDFTHVELQAIIVLDNVSFGEHDWEALNTTYSKLELENYGLEMPNFSKELLSEEEETVVTFNAKKKNASHDDYSVVDVLLHKDDKKVVTDLFDKIKTDHNYDVLSKAFMHVIKFYIDNNK